MPLSSEQARINGLKGGKKPGKLSVVRQMELNTKKIIEKMIYSKARPLIRAGMINAMGQNFVYRIDEERDSKGKLLTRKHILVTDSKEIAEALDKMEEGGKDPQDRFYYVTAKEPDIRAIEMLLNRAYGKPKESIKVETEVQFSLKDLAKTREDIKDQPLEVEARIIDSQPEDQRLEIPEEN